MSLEVGIIGGIVEALAPVADPEVIAEAVNDYLEDHPEATCPIDDTAGEGDTGKVWSADKSAGEVATLTEAITELEGEVEGITSDIQGYVEGWLDDHPEATTTVQDGSITPAKLESSFKARVEEVCGFSPTYTEVTGKYIETNGHESSSSAFNRSNPIPMSKGDIITFMAKGYNTGVAMIALSNEAGTSFTSAVASIDSTVRQYSYTATADGYYVVSYNKNSDHILIQYTGTTGKVLDNRIDVIDALKLPEFIDDAGFAVTADKTSATMSTTGYFVTKSGELSENSGFNISASISLQKGDVIKFNAKGYQTNVAVLAQDNGDSTYNPLVISEDSDEHTFRYMADEAMYVVISTNKNVTPVYSIYSSQVNKNDLRITDLENDYDCFAFATMGVIGDSLATGASNASGVHDRPVYSWGKYIEREHGISVSMFSKAGLTTRTFLTDSAGLTAMNAANALDCYVIGLGVNDKSDYTVSYLGSSSDVHVGSEDQNADTYYGNYSKIIAAIKTKSPRAKIFCVNNPRAERQSATGFNDAIADIVEMYTNTWLVDLASDPYYKSKAYDETWVNAHSTALGYKLIARNIYKHISEIIKANMDDFLDIQWIVENYQ